MSERLRPKHIKESPLRVLGGAVVGAFLLLAATKKCDGSYPPHDKVVDLGKITVENTGEKPPFPVPSIECTDIGRVTVDGKSGIGISCVITLPPIQQNIP